MADAIAPRNTVTFTVTSIPPLVRQRRTIARLMGMQPDIQRGLKALARRRSRTDNVVGRHGGRPWVNRARATRLARVQEGASFTLRITPQIIPDIRSVERFLQAKA